MKPVDRRILLVTGLGIAIGLGLVWFATWNASFDPWPSPRT
jgi:hypothetical protein